MLNSASFNPMNSSGIVSNSKGSVVVDGKTYPVKNVPYSEPGKSTFVPQYRDVIIIDGKKYPVEKVPDMMGCDKTKDVVVIDGKIYNVNNNILEGFLASLSKLNILA